MKYMVYTAIVASAPAVLLSWFMPNHELPWVPPRINTGNHWLNIIFSDRNNLVEE
jgi:hypothetical protein